MCIWKDIGKQKNILKKLHKDSQKEIIRTILHEIAHYVLSHDGPMIVGVKHYQEEEREAWNFADEWMQKNERYTKNR